MRRVRVWYSLFSWCTPSLLFSHERVVRLLAWITKSKTPPNIQIHLQEPKEMSESQSTAEVFCRPINAGLGRSQSSRSRSVSVGLSRSQSSRSQSVSAGLGRSVSDGSEEGDTTRLLTARARDVKPGTHKPGTHKPSCCCSFSLLNI